jgi:hypothetical protein
MPVTIQETTIRPDSISLTLADNPDPAAATLWIQAAVSQAADRDRPLAIAQGIALQSMRDEISAQIQAITQKHGRLP